MQDLEHDGPDQKLLKGSMNYYPSTTSEYRHWQVTAKSCLCLFRLLLINVALLLDENDRRVWG